MKTYYKIVEQDNGTIKTLFHGVNGSRTMPKGEWISATIKQCTDGSGGTVYLSGFHVLDSYKEAENYLQNFTNVKNRVIVPCYAKNIRKKEHSRSNVFLADKIKFI